MKTHSLVQGSAEWLAYRAQHFNASDAPAMLGCSPYKARAALLRELHTGLAGEVDASTQRLFDAGHRFEALARPLAEKIVGEDLYPVTGSNGRLSASFDGLTLGEDVVFEHKSANAELRGILGRDDAAEALPLHYRVQMEQQLMVSGADRALFMATLWDGEDCTFAAHCWYEPDAELRAKILRGWDQFAADLAAYSPPPIAEPARAEPMDSLPAVSVRLDGALSVAGNLPSFAVALKEFIARMPARPTTDNDFATVDAGCKALKRAEEALDAAEAGALASITDVEAMRRAVADCRKLARDTRLAAEKLVERRKLEIKEQAVLAARRALDLHIEAANAELAPMRLLPVAADFPGAIKGLRSISSMQDALDTTLANGKIAADAQARGIRANLQAFNSLALGDDLGFLFRDLHQLVHKAADDFAAVVRSRIAEHRAAEAAKEAKRQAEEAERIAAAERRAAAEAEARVRAEQEAQARREREAAEADRRRIAAEEAAAAEAQRRAVEQASREQVEREAQARIAEQQRQDQERQQRVQREALAQNDGVEVLTLPAVPPVAAPVTQTAPAVSPLARIVPAMSPAEPATLTLGMICERLQFTVRADFLTDALHVSPAAVQGKRPGTYTESQFQTICHQLQSHISAMGEMYGQQRAARWQPLTAISASGSTA